MFVQEEHHLEVEIETGMNDKMESKFTNKGEPHMDNELGDLILKITTEPFLNWEGSSVAIFRVKSPGLLSIWSSSSATTLDSIPSSIPDSISTLRWCFS